MKNYIMKYNHMDEYRNEIVNGKFDDFDEENPDFVSAWGIAVLELPWIDIELNISAACDGPNGESINKPSLAYFICLKGIDDEDMEQWISVGYVDHLFPVDVDFSADNWKEKLEKQMYDTLQKVIDKFGFKADAPNFRGDAEAHVLLGSFA